MPFNGNTERVTFDREFNMKSPKDKRAWRDIVSDESIAQASALFQGKTLEQSLKCYDLTGLGAWQRMGAEIAFTLFANAALGKGRSVEFSYASQQWILMMSNDTMNDCVIVGPGGANLQDSKEQRYALDAICNMIRHRFNPFNQQK